MTPASLPITFPVFLSPSADEETIDFSSMLPNPRLSFFAANDHSVNKHATNPLCGWWSPSQPAYFPTKFSFSYPIVG